MGDILVGTCSWTDPALVSSGWYPQGARGAEGRLRHYASRFPVVEADSTFYAVPSERVSALWAERTPEGFLFDVKAFALLTGHGARVGALPADLRPAGLAPTAWVRKSQLSPDTMTRLWQRSRRVAPLRDAGRLGTVLFQFSPWFAPGARALAYIEECGERAGTPIAVEFRHPGWLAPDRIGETAGFLRSRGIPLVAVDTPQGLPDSVPPVAEATRPHSRSYGSTGAARSGAPAARRTATGTTTPATNSGAGSRASTRSRNARNRCTCSSTTAAPRRRSRRPRRCADCWRTRRQAGQPDLTVRGERPACLRTRPSVPAGRRTAGRDP